MKLNFNSLPIGVQGILLVLALPFYVLYLLIRLSAESIFRKKPKQQACEICGQKPQLPPVCGCDKNGYCAAFRMQAEVDKKIVRMKKRQ